MKQKFLLITIMLVLVFGLGACSSQTSEPTSNELAGTQWIVTQIGPFEDVEGITFEFADEGVEAKGNAGCNDYTVEYFIDGDSIAFADFVTTRMACPDPAVVKMEQEYQLALLAVQSYARTEEGLDFYSGDGELLIHNEPDSIP